MERTLIKKVNNNNIDIDTIKKNIIENEIYNIRYHSRENNEMINLSNVKINIDMKLEEIKELINNKTKKISRFATPLETLQEKLINKSIIIDHTKLNEYNKTKSISLKLQKL